MRNIVFALLPTVLLLGILSLGFLGEPENDPWLNSSPLWGPGDPFYGRVARQRNHLADPVLIWRGRPGFHGAHKNVAAGAVNVYRNNALGFRDDEVEIPKPPGVHRVVNVGDSSTWGFNLARQEDTYSAQLERLMERHPSGGARWDIVNAGVVGYSSLQGAQYLRYRADALEPDVVTIYLGNNDPTPSTIKDEERVAMTAGPLHSWLRTNFFYLLIQKGILHLRSADFAKARKELMAGRTGPASEAQASVEGHYRLAARVTPAQHEENLREMVRQVRRLGARPILLAVPENLVWPGRVRPLATDVLVPEGFWGSVKIERDYLKRVRNGEPACQAPLAGHPYLCRVEPRDLAAAGLPGLEELERGAADTTARPWKRVKDAHNASVRRFAEGDTLGAVAGYEAALADAESCDCVLPKQQSLMLYNLGAARLVLGESDAAFAAFEASRRRWPFAMNPDYEDAFDRAVEAEQVEWIDLPALFAAGDLRFQGSALMHDWVHPNELGNALIARALAERLAAPP